MRTGRGDFFNIDARFRGDGAQDAERCNSGDDRRQEVEQGDDKSVDVDSIPEFVVGTEKDQSSP